MHTRLAEAMRYVEEIRAELLRKLDGADPRLIAQRPEEDKWSVAEVLDHLQMIESGIAKLIAKRVTKARAGGLGKEESTESVLGSIDFMGDTIDNAFIPAPEIIRPRADADPAIALAALAAARQSLREAATLADGLALGEIKHTHPIIGEIDLYQWIVFLGRHEARHIRQIERTLNSFPAPRTR
ncbi:MAG TPA: DinB family protein [Gemmatimonadaceae bacterium]|nr:DinB family protein [Gemmatimonadaceae bacterium]